MRILNGFVVWNATDDVMASQTVFNSKYDADKFIKNLREGFRKVQGYYLDSNWNRISPDDIKFEILVVKN